MKTGSSGRSLGRDRARNEFSDLPAAAQQEVLDFIAFVRARRTQQPSRKPTRRPTLQSEAFVGMWRGRPDLSDGAAWVRRLREDEWIARRG